MSCMIICNQLNIEWMQGVRKISERQKKNKSFSQNSCENRRRWKAKENMNSLLWLFNILKVLSSTATLCSAQKTNFSDMNGTSSFWSSFLRSRSVQYTYCTCLPLTITICIHHGCSRYSTGFIQHGYTSRYIHHGYTSRFNTSRYFSGF